MSNIDRKLDNINAGLFLVACVLLLVVILVAGCSDVRVDRRKVETLREERVDNGIKVTRTVTETVYAKPDLFNPFPAIVPE